MAADVEEIRARSDIVEVIGTFVPLKKRGRNWLGLCPFHQEKTPSFNVSELTQSFKCFGCGVGGDVFSFVERHENMTFPEAAEFLARRAGLTFDRGGRRDPAALSEREQLFAINADALAYFREMFEKASAARDYLYGRGLARETIHLFQLGYAPTGWDGLCRYLQRKRWDLRLAATAGLVHAGKSGDFYDAFRDRAMFPIHDEQDRVVGFGGRAFGDEQPKYLNTGETPIFAKSRLLYGLPFSRKKIASEGLTLLMEGYMDVIAAHQSGFSNAVATLGTSLTEEHARKLARLVPENPVVALVYDADNAGIKATLRASEALEKEGVEVRVVRLPSGEDPDSLLKRPGGAALFQRAVDSAVGRVEHQLERILATADSSTTAGAAKTLHRLVAILATVPTRAERDVYIDRIWQYHPLSQTSPDAAKQQLHLDAEAYAAGAHGQAGRRFRRSASGAEPARNTASAAPTGTQRVDSGPQPYRFRTALSREEREARDLRQFRSQIKPVRTAQPPSTAATKAEAVIMRALANGEWRAVALRAAEPDDMPSETGRAFRQFVEDNHTALQQQTSALARLIGAELPPDLADSIRGRLQESEADSLNEPITESLIDQCATTLRRHRATLRAAELTQDLERLLEKPSLDAAERSRVLELRRLLQELKGASD